LDTIDPNLPSKQWFHPTIWFYLWTGLTKRVW
ncbi:MAG: formyl transferase, partial [Mesorhizobium sp.]